MGERNECDVVSDCEMVRRRGGGMIVRMREGGMNFGGGKLREMIFQIRRRKIRGVKFKGG